MTRNARLTKRYCTQHLLTGLSPLQRSILVTLATAPKGRNPFTGAPRSGLPIHRVLRSVFAIADDRPTASQRASLSRSLRRLERARLIERPDSPYGVAITRAGRAVFLKGE
jgi:hypothetical protein